MVFLLIIIPIVAPVKIYITYLMLAPISKEIAKIVSIIFFFKLGARSLLIFIHETESNIYSSKICILHNIKACLYFCYAHCYRLY